MPVTTIIRPEFGEAVRAALGDLNTGQASYRTGISDTYIRSMKRGLVPSEAVLERFAKGIDADLKKLRIAAGYEQSVLSNDERRVIAAYRTGSPQKKEEMLELVSGIRSGGVNIWSRAMSRNASATTSRRVS